MQVNKNTSAPQGGRGARVKAPMVKLENGYVVEGYAPDLGAYYPSALEGKEEEIEKLFEIVQHLVGIDDEIISVTIRGRNAYTNKYYQITIKVSE